MMLGLSSFSLEWCFTLHDRCTIAVTISLIYRFDIVIYEYITGCMLKKQMFCVSGGELNSFVRSIDLKLCIMCIKRMFEEVMHDIRNAL